MKTLTLMTLLSALALQTASADPEPRFRVKPLDPSGLIPYVITEAVDGSRFRPGDRELAEWALQEWARSASGALRFERVEHEDAALLRFVAHSDAWSPTRPADATARLSSFDPTKPNSGRPSGVRHEPIRSSVTS